jgi:phage baseplate assembly protein W
MSNLTFKEYTIKNYDTIRGLSLKFLGDSSRWMDLVDLNNLDYPYIESIDESQYAEGYVTFYFKREYLSQEITIGAGLVLISKEGYKYETTGSTTKFSDFEHIDIHIRAVSAGSNYNAYIGDIQELEMDLQYISAIMNYEPVTLFSKYINKAEGYITVTLTGSSAFIPYGTTFYTAEDDPDIYVRSYYALESINLDSGTKSGNIKVRSTEWGNIGNVTSNKIRVINNASLQNIVSVTNKEAISNGHIVNVLNPGDTMLVPINLDDSSNTPMYKLEENNDVKLFKEDIYLDSSGDRLMDINGDYKRVAGLDNLKQAINLLLSTKKGTLAYHPEYGSNITTFLGETKTTLTLGIIKAEIRRAVLSEYRVKDIDSIDIFVDNDVIYIYIGVVPINYDYPVNLTFVV